MREGDNLILIKIDEHDYQKDIINEFHINNIDSILLNFNIIQDEMELLIDDLSISNGKLNLYRCNCLISSFNVSDVIITRVLSTIPLDIEINGFLLNEQRYEYIISYHEFNPKKNKSRLNHMYLRSRNIKDYIYIKK